MENGIFYIKLMYFPFSAHAKAEDSSDGCRFNNNFEHLFTIDTNFLGFRIDNQAFLISFKSTVSFKFMSKEPMSADNILVCWPLNTVGLGV